MKVLLCALNASFVHTALSLRYLEAVVPASYPGQVQVLEFTINDYSFDIMARIYREKPDVLCFSCYIWNTDYILDLCRDYKKVAPHCTIILGGPEVSYTAGDLLQQHRALDCIVRGEGEDTFPRLLQTLPRGDISGVPGISYRDRQEIVHNPGEGSIADLDRLPCPYRNEAAPGLQGRIIYYETSRGCPFRCSYCLSASLPGVRYASLEKVRADLGFLLRLEAKIIKFVDRTFNFDEARAREIMEYLLQQPGDCTFHFEIVAELLSPAMIVFLQQVPRDRFFFEIGIQTTHRETLACIGRHSSWDRLSHAVEQLARRRNIHLHLDLIAGLPRETFYQFSRTFNMAASLPAEHLQLGFLKLLPGSPLREQAADYGYVYQDRAPYEVLRHRDLSYREIIRIKYIEILLERYHNSNVFPVTLGWIRRHLYRDNYFAFYLLFSYYWENRQLYHRSHRREHLYSYLMHFIAEKHAADAGLVHDLLKYDFLSHHKSTTLPPGVEACHTAEGRAMLTDLIRKQDWLRERLPRYAGLSPREIRKNLHIEHFAYHPRQWRRLNRPAPVIFVYDPGKKIAVEQILVEFDE